MYEKTFPNKRFKHTLEFLQKHIPNTQAILDLGVENPFSKIMTAYGYTVENTKGEDLDIDLSTVTSSKAEVITAFEIFEHLLSPFNVLREIKGDKLVASIPLRLWFSTAYRSKTDFLDRHYHEFEDWQFDWLLKKAGWEIKDRIKWTNPVNKIGIRPLLRSFTPRYYAIYAERISSQNESAKKKLRYAIIMPAHNEEHFLAQSLNSVINQSLLPTKIIVVNDNSTDKTEAIIDAFTDNTPFVEKLNTFSSTEHIPGSKVINAFNKGLEILRLDYDFIVKLDADIILPNHYFKTIAKIFEMRPKVGIAGGFAYEQEVSGMWKLNHPMNKDHVRGAFKAYSQDCFKAIGGLKNAMGWDTVDELLAKYHGYTIYTDNSLKTKHLRPLGKAYDTKATQLQGKAMYTMRYGFLITIIASVKMAWKQQKVKVFIDNCKGYLNAKKDKSPFLVSKKEGIFIRKLRWRNIKAKIKIN